jgi:hypothetical protein
MVLSEYRTLKGHTIHVITFFDRGETCVFVLPNSVVRHEPIHDLAYWYPGGKRPDEVKEMKPHGGNGCGKFNVFSDDMDGWLRVHTDLKGTVPNDLACTCRSRSPNWFRERPTFRLRSVVPISRDGNTVELHAWFDAHMFPPTSASPPPVQH